MTLEILIIDDNEQKIDALRRVMNPLFPEGEILIEEALTIADARDMMHGKTYDLVILDMVIPELEGAEASRTGGVDYLDEIDDMATYEFHVSYDAIPRHLKLHLDVVGSRTKKWFVRENDIALFCLTSSIELAYRALKHQISFYYDHSNLETIEFISTSVRTNKLTKRLNKYVEKDIYQAAWYKEKFKETEEQPQ